MNDIASRTDLVANDSPLCLGLLQVVDEPLHLSFRHDLTLLGSSLISLVLSQILGCCRLHITTNACKQASNECTQARDATDKHQRHHDSVHARHDRVQVLLRLNIAQEAASQQHASHVDAGTAL